MHDSAQVMQNDACIRHCPPVCSKTASPRDYDPNVYLHHFDTIAWVVVVQPNCEIDEQARGKEKKRPTDLSRLRVALGFGSFHMGSCTSHRPQSSPQQKKPKVQLVDSQPHDTKWSRMERCEAKENTRQNTTYAIHIDVSLPASSDIHTTDMHSGCA